MTEIHPKPNNACIYLLFAFLKPLPRSSVLFTTVEKNLMMTTLKCEELIEFSLGSLPSASFGAVLQAVTAETPITDQVPLDWLLTVTSKLESERENMESERRGQKKHLKAETKSFGCSAILAHRNPKQTNVQQSLTSALPEQRERDRQLFVHELDTLQTPASQDVLQ